MPIVLPRFCSGSSTVGPAIVLNQNQFMKILFAVFNLVFVVGTVSGEVVTNSFVRNIAANWARVDGATATQSSLQAGGVASRAIDGNYNGAYPGGSVTHTDNGEAEGWWQVDLGEPREIVEIRLFNRSDCCANRLSNFSVLAGNDPDFTSNLYDSGNQDAAVGPGATASFSDIGVTARYVRVQRNADSLDGGNNAISLAEVEVLGAPLAGFVNLAPGSSPSQSSTLANSADPVAAKAIDGNLATPFPSGSTTHTATGVGGPVFWETLLPSPSGINEIALYNRGDCCADRLSNFRLSVFNGDTEVWGRDFFTEAGTSAPGIFSIQEDTGGFIAIGDRVRIELIDGMNLGATGSDVLSLREVEIYGTDSPSAAGFVITSIAYGADPEAVTLTWTARSGSSYLVRYSLDLQSWDADLGDGLSMANDENPDDGDLLTVTFPLEPAALDGLSRLYFRVEEE